MNALWLMLPLWVATSILAFRIMLEDHRRRRRIVTRGDVAFITYMAAHGPIVLPLMVVILAGDKPSKFFSKEVTAESERTGA